MNTDETKVNMEKVLEVLKTDVATVRTGRATPSLVEHITISVYGGSTRLKVMELATIGTQDTQTLLITPFDHTIINEIQKGIQEANVGLSPVVDGQIIRISIPPLSQERREQLIHLMKQKLENGRIMVRQVRQEAMHDIKKQYNEKAISEDEMVRLEKEVQRLTDDTISEIDTLGKRKEEELLQI
ncbi:ribosome recycling factor [Candidatus Shapirobacteria bacterium]|nr:ribosome recycling factor [Candidatus Shapirobacteria bacterium]